MSGRYENVAAKLDRQLLDRAAPPSHATARQQLKAAEIEVGEIIAVRPEAILYVTPAGQVMTAWSQVRDKAGAKVVFYCEPGMPAWPPAIREQQG